MAATAYEADGVTGGVVVAVEVTAPMWSMDGVTVTSSRSDGSAYVIIVAFDASGVAVAARVLEATRADGAAGRVAIHAMELDTAGGAGGVDAIIVAGATDGENVRIHAQGASGSPTVRYFVGRLEAAGLTVTAWASMRKAGATSTADVRAATIVPDGIGGFWWCAHTRGMFATDATGTAVPPPADQEVFVHYSGALEALHQVTLDGPADTLPLSSFIGDGRGGVWVGGTYATAHTRGATPVAAYAGGRPVITHIAGDGNVVVVHVVPAAGGASALHALQVMNDCSLYAVVEVAGGTLTFPSVAAVVPGDGRSVVRGAVTSGCHASRVHHGLATTSARRFGRHAAPGPAALIATSPVVVMQLGPDEGHGYVMAAYASSTTGFGPITGGWASALHQVVVVRLSRALMVTAAYAYQEASSTPRVVGVMADGTGGVWVVGSTTSTNNAFGGACGTVTTHGSEDVYAARYTTSGTLLTCANVARIGTAAVEIAYGAAPTTTGGVVIAMATHATSSQPLTTGTFTFTSTRSAATYGDAVLVALDKAAVAVGMFHPTASTGSACVGVVADGASGYVVTTAVTQSATFPPSLSVPIGNLVITRVTAALAHVSSWIVMTSGATATAARMARDADGVVTAVVAVSGAARVVTVLPSGAPTVAAFVLGTTAVKVDSLAVAAGGVVYGTVVASAAVTYDTTAVVAGPNGGTWTQPTGVLQLQRGTAVAAHFHPIHDMGIGGAAPQLQALAVSSDGCEIIAGGQAAAAGAVWSTATAASAVLTGGTLLMTLRVRNCVPSTAPSRLPYRAALPALATVRAVGGGVVAMAHVLASDVRTGGASALPLAGAGGAAAGGYWVAVHAIDTETVFGLPVASSPHTFVVVRFDAIHAARAYTFFSFPYPSPKQLERVAPSSAITALGRLHSVVPEWSAVISLVPDTTGGVWVVANVAGNVHFGGDLLAPAAYPTVAVARFDATARHVVSRLLESAGVDTYTNGATHAHGGGIVVAMDVMRAVAATPMPLVTFGTAIEWMPSAGRTRDAALLRLTGDAVVADILIPVTPAATAVSLRAVARGRLADDDNIVFSYTVDATYHAAFARLGDATVDAPVVSATLGASVRLAQSRLAVDASGATWFCDTWASTGVANVAVNLDGSVAFTVATVAAGWQPFEVYMRMRGSVLTGSRSPVAATASVVSACSVDADGNMAVAGWASGAHVRGGVEVAAAPAPPPDLTYVSARPLLSTVSGIGGFAGVVGGDLVPGEAVVDLFASPLGWGGITDPYAAGVGTGAVRVGGTCDVVYGTYMAPEGSASFEPPASAPAWGPITRRASLVVTEATGHCTAPPPPRDAVADTLTPLSSFAVGAPGYSVLRVAASQHAAGGYWVWCVGSARGPLKIGTTTYAPPLSPAALEGLRGAILRITATDHAVASGLTYLYGGDVNAAIGDHAARLVPARDGGVYACGHARGTIDFYDGAGSGVFAYYGTGSAPYVVRVTEGGEYAALWGADFEGRVTGATLAIGDGGVVVSMASPARNITLDDTGRWRYVVTTAATGVHSVIAALNEALYVTAAAHHSTLGDGSAVAYGVTADCVSGHYRAVAYVTPSSTVMFGGSAGTLTTPATHGFVAFVDYAVSTLQRIAHAEVMTVSADGAAASLRLARDGRGGWWVGASVQGTAATAGLGSIATAAADATQWADTYVHVASDGSVVAQTAFRGAAAVGAPAVPSGAAEHWRAAVADAPLGVVDIAGDGSGGVYATAVYANAHTRGGVALPAVDDGVSAAPLLLHMDAYAHVRSLQTPVSVIADPGQSTGVSPALRDGSAGVYTNVAYDPRYCAVVVGIAAVRGATVEHAAPHGDGSAAGQRALIFSVGDLPFPSTSTKGTTGATCGGARDATDAPCDVASVARLVRGVAAESLTFLSVTRGAHGTLWMAGAGAGVTSVGGHTVAASATQLVVAYLTGGSHMVTYAHAAPWPRAVTLRDVRTVLPRPDGTFVVGGFAGTIAPAAGVTCASKGGEDVFAVQYIVGKGPVAIVCEGEANDEEAVGAVSLGTYDLVIVYNSLSVHASLVGEPDQTPNTEWDTVVSYYGGSTDARLEITNSFVLGVGNLGSTRTFGLSPVCERKADVEWSMRKFDSIHLNVYLTLPLADVEGSTAGAFHIVRVSLDGAAAPATAYTVNTPMGIITDAMMVDDGDGGVWVCGRAAGILSTALGALGLVSASPSAPIDDFAIRIDPATGRVLAQHRFAGGTAGVVSARCSGDGRGGVWIASVVSGPHRRAGRSIAMRATSAPALYSSNTAIDGTYGAAALKRQAVLVHIRGDGVVDSVGELGAMTDVATPDADAAVEVHGVTTLAGCGVVAVGQVYSGEAAFAADGGAAVHTQLAADGVGVGLAAVIREPACEADRVTVDGGTVGRGRGDHVWGEGRCAMRVISEPLKWVPMPPPGHGALKRDRAAAVAAAAATGAANGTLSLFAAQLSAPAATAGGAAQATWASSSAKTRTTDGVRSTRRAFTASGGPPSTLGKSNVDTVLRQLNPVISLGKMTVVRMARDVQRRYWMAAYATSQATVGGLSVVGATTGEQLLVVIYTDMLKAISARGIAIHSRAAAVPRQLVANVYRGAYMAVDIRTGIDVGGGHEELSVRGHSSCVLVRYDHRGGYVASTVLAPRRDVLYGVESPMEDVGMEGMVTLRTGHIAAVFRAHHWAYYRGTRALVTASNSNGYAVAVITPDLEIAEFMSTYAAAVVYDCSDDGPWRPRFTLVQRFSDGSIGHSQMNLTLEGTPVAELSTIELGYTISEQARVFASYVHTFAGIDFVIQVYDTDKTLTLRGRAGALTLAGVAVHPRGQPAVLPSAVDYVSVDGSAHYVRTYNSSATAGASPSTTHPIPFGSGGAARQAIGVLSVAGNATTGVAALDMEVIPFGSATQSSVARAVARGSGTLFAPRTLADGVQYGALWAATAGATISNPVADMHECVIGYVASANVYSTDGGLGVRGGETTVLGHAVSAGEAVFVRETIKHCLGNGPMERLECMAVGEVPYVERNQAPNPPHTLFMRRAPRVLRVFPSSQNQLGLISHLSFLEAGVDSKPFYGEDVHASLGTAEALVFFSTKFGVSFIKPGELWKGTRVDAASSGDSVAIVGTTYGDLVMSHTDLTEQPISVRTGIESSCAFVIFFSEMMGMQRLVEIICSAASRDEVIGVAVTVPSVGEGAVRPVYAFETTAWAVRSIVGGRSLHIQLGAAPLSRLGDRMRGLWTGVVEMGYDLVDDPRLPSEASNGQPRRPRLLLAGQLHANVRILALSTVGHGRLGFAAVGTSWISRPGTRPIGRSAAAASVDGNVTNLLGSAAEDLRSLRMSAQDRTKARIRAAHTSQYVSGHSMETLDFGAAARGRPVGEPFVILMDRQLRITSYRELGLPMSETKSPILIGGTDTLGVADDVLDEDGIPTFVSRLVDDAVGGVWLCGTVWGRPPAVLAIRGSTSPMYRVGDKPTTWNGVQSEYSDVILTRFAGPDGVDGTPPLAVLGGLRSHRGPGPLSFVANGGVADGTGGLVYGMTVDVAGTTTGLYGVVSKDGKSFELGIPDMSLDESVVGITDVTIGHGCTAYAAAKVNVTDGAGTLEVDGVIAAQVNCSAPAVPVLRAPEANVHSFIYVPTARVLRLALSSDGGYWAVLSASMIDDIMGLPIPKTPAQLILVKVASTHRAVAAVSIATIDRAEFVGTMAAHGGASSVAALVCDGSGGVWVVGTTAAGTINFGGTPLTGRGGDEVFAARYGTSAEHIASAMLGTPATEFAYGAAEDVDGGIVVAMTTTAAVVDIAPPILNTDTADASGAEDPVLLRLSGRGVVTAAKHYAPGPGGVGARFVGVHAVCGGPGVDAHVVLAFVEDGATLTLGGTHPALVGPAVADIRFTRGELDLVSGKVISDPTNGAPGQLQHGSVRGADASRVVFCAQPQAGTRWQFATRPFPARPWSGFVTSHVEDMLYTTQSLVDCATLRATNSSRHYALLQYTGVDEFRSEVPYTAAGGRQGVVVGPDGEIVLPVQPPGALSYSEYTSLIVLPSCDVIVGGAFDGKLQLHAGPGGTMAGAGGVIVRLTSADCETRPISRCDAPALGRYVVPVPRVSIIALATGPNNGWWLVGEYMGGYGTYQGRLAPPLQAIFESPTGAFVPLKPHVVSRYAHDGQLVATAVIAMSASPDYLNIHGDHANGVWLVGSTRDDYIPSFDPFVNGTAARGPTPGVAYLANLKADATVARKVVIAGFGVTASAEGNVGGVLVALRPLDATVSAYTFGRTAVKDVTTGTSVVVAYDTYASAPVAKALVPATPAGDVTITTISQTCGTRSGPTFVIGGTMTAGTSVDLGGAVGVATAGASERRFVTTLASRTLRAEALTWLGAAVGRSFALARGGEGDIWVCGTAAGAVTTSLGPLLPTSADPSDVYVRYDNSLTAVAAHRGTTVAGLGGMSVSACVGAARHGVYSLTTGVRVSGALKDSAVAHVRPSGAGAGQLYMHEEGFVHTPPGDVKAVVTAAAMRGCGPLVAFSIYGTGVPRVGDVAIPASMESYVVWHRGDVTSGECGDATGHAALSTHGVDTCAASATDPQGGVAVPGASLSGPPIVEPDGFGGIWILVHTKGLTDFMGEPLPAGVSGGPKQLILARLSTATVPYKVEALVALAVGYALDLKAFVIPDALGVWLVAPADGTPDFGLGPMALCNYVVTRYSLTGVPLISRGYDISASGILTSAVSSCGPPDSAPSITLVVAAFKELNFHQSKSVRPGGAPYTGPVGPFADDATDADSGAMVELTYRNNELERTRTGALGPFDAIYTDLACWCDSSFARTGGTRYVALRQSSGQNKTELVVFRHNDTLASWAQRPHVFVRESVTPVILTDTPLAASLAPDGKGGWWVCAATLGNSQVLSPEAPTLATQMAIHLTVHRDPTKRASAQIVAGTGSHASPVIENGPPRCIPDGKGGVWLSATDVGHGGPDYGGWERRAGDGMAGGELLLDIDAPTEPWEPTVTDARPLLMRMRANGAVSYADNFGFTGTRALPFDVDSSVVAGYPFGSHGGARVVSVSRISDCRVAVTAMIDEGSEWPFAGGLAASTTGSGMEAGLVIANVWVAECDESDPAVHATACPAAIPFSMAPTTVGRVLRMAGRTGGGYYVAVYGAGLHTFGGMAVPGAQRAHAIIVVHYNADHAGVRIAAIEWGVAEGPGDDLVALAEDTTGGVWLVANRQQASPTVNFATTSLGDTVVTGSPSLGDGSVGPSLGGAMDVVVARYDGQLRHVASRRVGTSGTDAAVGAAGLAGGGVVVAFGTTGSGRVRSGSVVIDYGAPVAGAWKAAVVAVSAAGAVAGGAVVRADGAPDRDVYPLGLSADCGSGGVTVVVAGAGPLRVGGTVGVAPASGSVHVVDMSSRLEVHKVTTLATGAHTAAFGALVVPPAGPPATPGTRLRAVMTGRGGDGAWLCARVMAPSTVVGGTPAGRFDASASVGDLYVALDAAGEAVVSVNFPHSPSAPADGATALLDGFDCVSDGHGGVWSVSTYATSHVRGGTQSIMPANHDRWHVLTHITATGHVDYSDSFAAWNADGVTAGTADGVALVALDNCQVVVATRVGGGAIVEYDRDTIVTSTGGLVALHQVRGCSAGTLSPLPSECSAATQPIPESALVEPARLVQLVHDGISDGGMWAVFSVAPAGGPIMGQTIPAVAAGALSYAVLRLVPAGAALIAVGGLHVEVASGGKLDTRGLVADGGGGVWLAGTFDQAITLLPLGPPGAAVTLTPTLPAGVECDSFAVHVDASGAVVGLKQLGYGVRVISAAAHGADGLIIGAQATSHATQLSPRFAINADAIVGGPDGTTTPWRAALVALDGAAAVVDLYLPRHELAATSAPVAILRECGTSAWRRTVLDGIGARSVDGDGDSALLATYVVAYAIEMVDSGARVVFSGSTAAGGGAHVHQHAFNFTLGETFGLAIARHGAALGVKTISALATIIGGGMPHDDLRVQLAGTGHGDVWAAFSAGTQDALLAAPAIIVGRGNTKSTVDDLLATQSGTRTHLYTVRVDSSTFAPAVVVPARVGLGTGVSTRGDYVASLSADAGGGVVATYAHAGPIAFGDGAVAPLALEYGTHTEHYDSMGHAAWQYSVPFTTSNLAAHPEAVPAGGFYRPDCRYVAPVVASGPVSGTVTTHMSAPFPAVAGSYVVTFDDVTCARGNAVLPSQQCAAAAAEPSLSGWFPALLAHAVRAGDDGGMWACFDDATGWAGVPGVTHTPRGDSDVVVVQLDNVGKPVCGVTLGVSGGGGAAKCGGLAPAPEDGVWIVGTASATAASGTLHAGAFVTAMRSVAASAGTEAYLARIESGCGVTHAAVYGTASDDALATPAALPGGRLAAIFATGATGASIVVSPSSVILSTTAAAPTVLHAVATFDVEAKLETMRAFQSPSQDASGAITNLLYSCEAELVAVVVPPPAVTIILGRPRSSAFTLADGAAHLVQLDDTLELLGAVRLFYDGTHPDSFAVAARGGGGLWVCAEVSGTLKLRNHTVTAGAGGPGTPRDHVVVSFDAGLHVATVAHHGTAGDDSLSSCADAGAGGVWLAGGTSDLASGGAYGSKSVYGVRGWVEATGAVVRPVATLVAGPAVSDAYVVSARGAALPGTGVSTVVRLGDCRTAIIGRVTTAGGASIGLGDGGSIDVPTGGTWFGYVRQAACVAPAPAVCPDIQTTTPDPAAASCKDGIAIVGDGSAIANEAEQGPALEWRWDTADRGVKFKPRDVCPPPAHIPLSYSGYDYIRSPAPSAEEQFCTALAATSETVAVGSAGSVTLYERIGGSISNPYARVATVAESRALRASGYGSTVALRARVLVTGAPHDSSASTVLRNGGLLPDSGAAYVYERDTTDPNVPWPEVAYLRPPHAFASGTLFGCSVDVSSDGRVIVVGAKGDARDAYGTNGFLSVQPKAPSLGGLTHARAGAAYVFARSTVPGMAGLGSGVWTPTAALREAHADAGPGREFGAAVSVDGYWPEYTVAVGVPKASIVYLYALTVADWSADAALVGTPQRLEQSTFSPPVGVATEFGHSVAICAAVAPQFVLAVGAPADPLCSEPSPANVGFVVGTPATTCVDRGAVRIYRGAAGALTQTAFFKGPMGPTVGGARIGTSVKCRGGTISAQTVHFAIGSPGDVSVHTGPSYPTAPTDYDTGSTAASGAGYTVWSDNTMTQMPLYAKPLHDGDSNPRMGTAADVVFQDSHGVSHGFGLFCAAGAGGRLGGINPTQYEKGGDVDSGALYVVHSESYV